MINISLANSVRLQVQDDLRVEQVTCQSSLKGDGGLTQVLQMKTG